MVLVPAVDMVRGVLHASRAQRARLQWTIQVYTQTQVWSFSTWAVLAIMWHLGSGGSPGDSTEDIAPDLHARHFDQDFSWRRWKGDLPVAPGVEELSLEVTLQRHPNKMARPFLQTGTVSAALPGTVTKWDSEESQPVPDPWVSPSLKLCQGHPGPCHSGPQGNFPTASAARRPALQPAGGSGLGSVKRERTPGPILPPGARGGLASR